MNFDYPIMVNVVVVIQKIRSLKVEIAPVKLSMIINIYCSIYIISLTTSRTTD